MEGAYSTLYIGAYPELVIVRECESGRKAFQSEQEGVNDYTAFRLEVLGARQVGPGVGHSAMPVGIVVWLSVPLGMPVKG